MDDKYIYKNNFEIWNHNKITKYIWVNLYWFKFHRQTSKITFSFSFGNIDKNSIDKKNKRHTHRTCVKVLQFTKQKYWSLFRMTIIIVRDASQNKNASFGVGGPKVFSNFHLRFFGTCCTWPWRSSYILWIFWSHIGELGLN